jgi:hypothetical protein
LSERNEPLYAKGKTECPAVRIATMLKIHFLEEWVSLSASEIEEGRPSIPRARGWFASANTATGTARAALTKTD